MCCVWRRRSLGRTRSSFGARNISGPRAVRTARPAGPHRGPALGLPADRRDPAPKRTGGVQISVARAGGLNG